MTTQHDHKTAVTLAAVGFGLVTYVNFLNWDSPVWWRISSETVVVVILVRNLLAAFGFETWF